MTVVIVCLAERYEGFSIEGVFSTEVTAQSFIEAQLRERIVGDTESYFYKVYEIDGNCVSTVEVEHTYTLDVIQYKVSPET